MGCSSDSGGPGEDNPEPADATVTVANFSFTPSAVNITPGQTVRWTFSTGPHNVTFADGATGSGDRSSGSFDRTFSAAGTFAYQCTLHAGMNGSVVVAAAGTGGGTGGGGTGGGGTGGGGGGGGGGGYDG